MIAGGAGGGWRFLIAPETVCDSSVVELWCCCQDFLVTFKNRDNVVAPGLGLTAVIEYLARDEDERSDVLMATIDGCSVDIPIRA